MSVQTLQQKKRSIPSAESRSMFVQKGTLVPLQIRRRDVNVIGNGIETETFVVDLETKQLLPLTLCCPYTGTWGPPGVLYRQCELWANVGVGNVVAVCSRRCVGFVRDHETYPWKIFEVRPSGLQDTDHKLTYIKPYVYNYAYGFSTEVLRLRLNADGLKISRV